MAMIEPRMIHVTTTDISLSLLLGPQLRAFSAAGYEVIGASAPGPYVEELVSWGVQHVPLRHATRAMAPHRDLKALRELLTLFRSRRPHIVHTHNPKPGVYGRLAARAANVPVIVNTVHGLYAQPTDGFIKKSLVYCLERIAASCSHAELVQNPEDLDLLSKLRVPNKKLQLLGNGVDLHRFRPGRISSSARSALRREIGAGPDDVVCGVVGRLVWEKGYREIFRAAHLLRQRCPRARFVVVGPDDPEKLDGVSPEEIQKAQAEGGIVFLGVRHDVETLYEVFDLYVLASHREGFPRSAMEAAATGLPIVATNIRGCRQVVEHGSSGLLVPVRHPEALAAAVERLVEDDHLRRQMGAIGRQKALKEFDQQRVIELTLDTYDRLIREVGM